MGVRHRTPKSRKGIAAMEPILWEWLSMAVRWLHVIAGIAWIGSSFYFVHLDSSLKQRAGLPTGASGDAWQVHGGGFYHMVKYLVAPAQMPESLTWFKWEAYATWLSRHGSVDHRLLFRRAALPDRYLGTGFAGLGCGSDQRRRPGPRLGGLRPAVQVEARRQRYAAVRGVCSFSCWCSPSPTLSCSAAAAR